MASKTNKDEQVEIILKPIKTAISRWTIVGDTPLIVHSWSQKARLEMLAKQMQIVIEREPKNPIEQFWSAMYRMDDEGYGFPSVGIKDAMVTVCVELNGIAKAAARRAFRVHGERGHSHASLSGLTTPMDLVRIYSPEPPRMREDTVRLSGPGRTPDLRYRPEFWPWAIDVQIEHVVSSISAPNLAKLLQYAGFQIGIGEWRMEKGGDLGCFHMASAAEAKRVTRWRNVEQKQPELPTVDDWRREIDARRSEEKVA